MLVLVPLQDLCFSTTAIVWEVSTCLRFSAAHQCKHNELRLKLQNSTVQFLRDVCVAWLFYIRVSVAKAGWQRLIRTMETGFSVSTRGLCSHMLLFSEGWLIPATLSEPCRDPLWSRGRNQDRERCDLTSLIIICLCFSKRRKDGCPRRQAGRVILRLSLRAVHALHWLSHSPEPAPWVWVTTLLLLFTGVLFVRLGPVPPVLMLPFHVQLHHEPAGLLFPAAAWDAGVGHYDSARHGRTTEKGTWDKM